MRNEVIYVVELHLGRRIAYTRKKSNKTQLELAKSIHVSSSHLGNIETGKYQASNDVLFLMSENMDVPISYLLNWDKANEETGQKIQRLFAAVFKNDFDEAEDLIKLLKHPIESIEQESSKYMLEAVYYFKRGIINKAFAIENDYLSMFLPIDNIEDCSTEFQLYYYYYVMQSRFIKENFQESYLAGKKMLDLWDDQNGDITSIYLNLSNISMKLLYYEDSLTYIEKALSLLDTPSSNEQLYCSAYIQLSALYIKTKQYDKAINAVNELKEFVEQINSNEIKAIVFQHIGTIYLNQDVYHQALNYFQKSYDLIIPVPIEIVQSIIICHIRLQSFDEAKKYLLIAEKYITTEYNQMLLLVYKAEILLKEGNEKEYWKIQKKTIRYFIKYNHVEKLFDIYNHLAKYYFSENRYKESATYFMEMERLKDEKNFKENGFSFVNTNFTLNSK